MKLLYIIGVPGSGKTTLVKKLTKEVPSEVKTAPYVSWTEYSPECCQLGYDRGTFGGTDALGMAAQKHVQNWLLTCEYKYVLAEGDRLANGKFFQFCRENDIDITIVCIDVAEKTSQERREKRNAAIGKQQNEQWLKTRHTKVDNIKSEFISKENIINGNLPIKDVAKSMLKYRVVKEIRKLRKQ